MLRVIRNNFVSEDILGLGGTHSYTVANELSLIFLYCSLINIGKDKNALNSFLL